MAASEHSDSESRSAQPQPPWARKSDLCAEILAEAARLLRAGRFGAAHNQLLARAGELLDDIDEALVGAPQDRGHRPIAVAAALHREFDRICAAITAAQRIGTG